MTGFGPSERATQNSVVALFQKRPDWRYLAGWLDSAQFQHPSAEVAARTMKGCA